MTTLTEYQAIESKATKGPFQSTFNFGKERGVRAKGGFVCFLPAPTRYTGQDDRYEKELEENKADAEHIAISRSALPALIAVAEEMAEVISREIKTHRATAALIDDRNKGGQLKEITDSMRMRALKLEKDLAAFEAWKNEIEGEK